MGFIIGAIIFLIVIVALSGSKGTAGRISDIILWLIRAAGVLFAIMLVIVFVLDILM